ncbi:MAG: ATP-binding protein [Candidatus Eisenbacteria bacterium]
MLRALSSDTEDVAPSILLLEPDPDRTVFARSMLTAGPEGLSPKISVAATVEALKQYAGDGTHAAIVVDLEGGSDGRLDLLEQARSVAGALPVIALVPSSTDSAAGSDRADAVATDAVALGADDVVEKTTPFAPRLWKAIGAACRRNSEVDRLRRRVQDLELFTRTAAHDIQRPLRTMNLVVEMLLEGDDGRLRKDQLECLLALRNQVHKLDLLSDGLFQLATLGREALRLRPVPVDDVVAEVAELVGSEANEYLHYSSMPTVLADRTLLVSLLHNLVDNGLRYVRGKSPHVRVCACREGDFIRVDVTDNGIGIPGHLHESVFLPFVRGASASASPGNGLGLAMCRRIVELHGGEIWVRESSDQGTTISLTLPLG